MSGPAVVAVYDRRRSLPCRTVGGTPGLAVNENPIVTARPVTRIGDEWFLPLVPIAEALGAEIQVSGDPQQLNVRRSDGTTVSYDSRTGEIRSRVVLVGRVLLDGRLWCKLRLLELSQSP